MLSLFNRESMKPMKAFIFYRGPSLLDGESIVAIATKSRNKKTGNMVQTWILREDIDPVTAARNGKDKSVCGQCVHRGRYESDGKRVRVRVKGSRTCYVQMYVPLVVWNTYERKRYDDLTA